MILLTDTSSLAHRIFHTTTQFTINGDPCGVPVGFMRSMARICVELKESFLEPIVKVACLDFGRCLWRTEAYPEYKAKRDRPKVHDFAPQMDTLERALPEFGFQVCKAFGTEADDLIGVLAQELETSTDERIVIVSSDKDLWQLITDRVRVYDLSRDMLIGPDQARELLGFSHERLVEYKALAGDSSDNIPGAKGVGEKTAKKILEEHPDLRALLVDLGARESSEGLSSELKKVAASKDDVLLAGKLCTIAQFRDQLWNADARDAVKETFDAVVNKAVRPFDSTATAVLADFWRTDDANWDYAFR